jgi:hypothetical protein
LKYVRWRDSWHYRVFRRLPIVKVFRWEAEVKLVSYKALLITTNTKFLWQHYDTECNAGMGFATHHFHWTSIAIFSTSIQAEDGGHIISTGQVHDNIDVRNWTTRGQYRLGNPGQSMTNFVCIRSETQAFLWKLINSWNKFCQVTGIVQLQLWLDGVSELEKWLPFFYAFLSNWGCTKRKACNQNTFEKKPEKKRSIEIAQGLLRLVLDYQTVCLNIQMSLSIKIGQFWVEGTGLRLMFHSL